MRLHPYIEAHVDPFDRLRAAYFWEVADKDFRNADYWRDQIEQCKAGVRALADAWIDSPMLSTDVKCRRLAEMDRACAVAMVDAYQQAGYRRRECVGIPNAH